MKDRIFLDTNILVYAYMESDKIKQQKAKALLQDNLNNIVFISAQVVNEFYSVMQKNKIEHLSIKKNIFDMSAQFNISDISFNLILKALSIKEKYFFSLWDSLIVAAALQNNCSTLYSEDMQHKQLIETKMEITNPFY